MDFYATAEYRPSCMAFAHCSKSRCWLARLYGLAGDNSIEMYPATGFRCVYVVGCVFFGGNNEFMGERGATGRERIGFIVLLNGINVSVCVCVCAWLWASMSIIWKFSLKLVIKCWTTRSP